MTVQYRQDETRELIYPNGMTTHVVAERKPVEDPPSGTTRRGPLFWVCMTLIGVLVVAGVGVGSFLFGQSSRPSDAQIADRIADKAAADKTFYTGKMKAALTDQRKHLKDVMDRRVKKASKKSFEKGQSQGYSSGQAAGYSSGQVAGEEQGKAAGLEEGREIGQVEGWTDGFDEGTCYDPYTYEYVC